MSDNAVSEFYTKNGEEYIRQYRIDHSPRIKAMIDKYGLKSALSGKRLVDVGGGLGFAGELLDKSTDYWVIDGADIDPAIRVSEGNWFKADLDYNRFSTYRDTVLGGQFDAAFCLETLEHVGNPHHLLVEIKNLVKPNGHIYISVPTETVWHNTPYPGLLWPPQNFAMFLGQMALPIEDFYIYQPTGPGWPAYQFKCRNAGWEEKKLVFPKDEAKFLPLNPIECTNI